MVNYIHIAKNWDELERGGEGERDDSTCVATAHTEEHPHNYMFL